MEMPRFNTMIGSLLQPYPCSRIRISLQFTQPKYRPFLNFCGAFLAKVVPIVSYDRSCSADLMTLPNVPQSPKILPRIPDT